MSWSYCSSLDRSFSRCWFRIESTLSRSLFSRKLKSPNQNTSSNRVVTSAAKPSETGHQPDFCFGVEQQVNPQILPLATHAHAHTHTHGFCSHQVTHKGWIDRDLYLGRSWEVQVLGWFYCSPVSSHTLYHPPLKERCINTANSCGKMEILCRI